MPVVNIDIFEAWVGYLKLCNRSGHVWGQHLSYKPMSNHFGSIVDLMRLGYTVEKAFHEVYFNDLPF